MFVARAGWDVVRVPLGPAEPMQLAQDGHTLGVTVVLVLREGVALAASPRVGRSSGTAPVRLLSAGVELPTSRADRRLLQLLKGPSTQAVRAAARDNDNARTSPAPLAAAAW